MGNARKVGMAIAIGMLCLAGCENEQRPDTSSASSTVLESGTPNESESSGAPHAARELALTAQELPAGTSVADFAMDADTVRIVVQPLTGARSASSRVEPADCSRLLSMFEKPTDLDPSTAGVIAGDGGRYVTFTEAVLPRRPDIAAVSARFRRCPSVQETIDNFPSVTIGYTVLDGFRSSADELVVVEERQEDANVKQRALLAYARVGEYAVWLRLRVFQGRPIDRALFDRLLDASIAKVVRGR